MPSGCTKLMASTKFILVGVAGLFVTCNAFAPTHLSYTSTNRFNGASIIDLQGVRPLFAKRSAYSPTVPRSERQAFAAPRFAMQASNSQSFGVVITGGAGGVGYAYADEFLRLGHRVVICDISPKISTAAEALQNKHPKGAIFHTICDVSDAASVQKLAEFSKQSLGTVNYWINNAAVNGWCYSRDSFEQKYLPVPHPTFPYHSKPHGTCEI